MSRETYMDVVNILNNNSTAHRHTAYQIKHFILNKETSHQGRIRKCLDELEARKSTLDNLAISIEETKDDITLAELDIECQQKFMNNLKNEEDKKRNEIAIRKSERRKMNLQFTLQNLTNKFRECEEETIFFLQAFRQLEEIEQLKPYDDAETQSQIWNDKYAEELHLRLMLQKPLDLELVKCILAMDNSAPIRAQMINIIEQIQIQAMHQTQAHTKRRTEMDQDIKSARKNENKGDIECQKESQH